MLNKNLMRFSINFYYCLCHRHAYENGISSLLLNFSKLKSQDVHQKIDSMLLESYNYVK